MWKSAEGFYVSSTLFLSGNVCLLSFSSQPAGGRLRPPPVQEPAAEVQKAEAHDRQQNDRQQGEGQTQRS